VCRRASLDLVAKKYNSIIAPYQELSPGRPGCSLALIYIRTVIVQYMYIYT